MSKWNGNRFSVYTSEEKSVLGLIKEMGDQTNYNTDEIERLTESDNKKVSHQEMQEVYKIDKQANFTGSWFGIKKPTQSSEGLAATVDQLIDETIPGINLQLKQNMIENNILKNLDNNKKLLIAHRGFGGIYPENTILAFQESLKNGANAIEFDVQPTSDGELVVIHDSTVDRTTNGSGRVDSMTLSQIKQLDAGYKFFNNTLTGITIPTIDELFQNINCEKYFWEIKEYRNNADVEKMVRYIVENGLEDRVILSTFSWKTLISVIRNISKRVSIDCTISTQQEFNEAIEQCKLDNRLGISMPSTLSNKTNNALLQKYGIHFVVWTFQEQNSYNYHKQFGVTNIISDVLLEV